MHIHKCQFFIDINVSSTEKWSLYWAWQVSWQNRVQEHWMIPISLTGLSTWAIWPRAVWDVSHHLFYYSGGKKIACVLDACFREEHFLLPCNSRWMRCYLCNVHLLYVPLLFSNIKAQKKQGLMERILYFSRVTKVMDPSGQTWLKDKSGSTNRTQVGSW